MFNKNERLAISEQRRRLPIYAHRTELLYLVEGHATTVVVGETGSGKTTQVPQYLHEAGGPRFAVQGGRDGRREAECQEAWQARQQPATPCRLPCRRLDAGR